MRLLLVLSVSIVIILVIVFGFGILIVKAQSWGVERTGDLGSLGSAFGILTSLFSGLSLIGIGFGFYMTYKGLLADHDRRKKDSTIKAVQELDMIINQGRGIFGAGFSVAHQPLSSESLTPKKRQYLDTLLSSITYFAVGVDSGVYDRQLALLCFGPSLDHVFKWALPYAVLRRSETRCDEYYRDGQLLAEEFSASWGTLFLKPGPRPSDVVSARVRDV